MKSKDSYSTKSKFEFPGSVAHYPRILYFTIEHMVLKIKPNFNSSTLTDCEQTLKIVALQDINEVKLDAAEIKVHNVLSSLESIPIVGFETVKKEDELIIKLGEILRKGSALDLFIIYSAGYYSENGITQIRKPRSGFHFISPDDQSPSKEAWTQGQALESRYWFPCLDDPRVRFTTEICVTAPSDEFIVISNGELASKEDNTWIWQEPNPNTGYLVSVVIGTFAQEQQKYDENVSLFYYWPKEISKKNAMLTFANTPDMTRFLEEYLDTKYPYKKYSQVAVDDFEFSGMENTNSTTLTKDILHDERVACDYQRDIEIILHELTHQWLGDLVTINDWSHLWLSEGFATYFEHLYWENRNGVDEFQYKIMQTADNYFEESNRQYDRPIVTNIYKHPDELCDAHSYEKGGCVLHMLRSYIGDENFRKSLKIYIETHRGKSVKTDDLRKIIEKVSGENLLQFFDQWIYRGGHPQLNLEFSLEGSLIKLKIIQMQVANDDDYMAFKFPLDIKLVFSSNGNDSDNKKEIIEISKKVTEKTFNFRRNAKIRWISIDPNFKILKEIKSIKVVNETNEFQLREMLKNQLIEGETVIERIEASRALKKFYSEDAVDALQCSVRKDSFYGVSIEAANTLGAYYDKDNYPKTNRAYHAIRHYVDKKIFSTLRAEIRRAILRNMGEFGREESINLLEPILLKEDESYFVRAAAAAAIGKSSKNTSSSTKKEKIIPILKTAVKKTSSFQNVIAAGAIDGLKELSKDKDNDVIVEIANFLIENSHYDQDYFIRLAATSALGKFLHTTNDENGLTLEEINQKAFDRLMKLLRDKRRKVKSNACTALSDTDAKPPKPTTRIFETIDALISVAQYDLDGLVRSQAERSMNIVREWVREWADKPPKIDIKIREEPMKGINNNRDTNMKT